MRNFLVANFERFHDLDGVGINTDTDLTKLAADVRYLRSVEHTSHHISNFTIDIDGDEAHCESYVMTTLLPADGETVTLGGARYIDHFTRKNGRWAIAHREAVMDFNLTVPRD